MHPVLQYVMHIARIVLEGVVDVVRSLASNFLPAGTMPRYDLTGQVVLITGSGSGLGRGMALRFADMPVRLVLWDVNEAGNKETAKMCEEKGLAEVHSYTVDISSREAIYAAAEKVRSEVGDVYMVVNNAGVGSGAPFLSKDDDRMELTVKINMLSHFWMAKAFLPHMIDVNAGHIVSVASLSGVVGAKDLVDYSASKFGAVGFQEALENECYDMGKDGIHFTTICPTYVSTNMLKKIPVPSKKNVITPEYAVEMMMDAILTRKRIFFSPRHIYLAYAGKGLLPRRTFQKLLVWQMNQ